MQISVPFKALSSPIFWFRSCKRVERRPAGAARNPFPVCAGSLRVKSLAEISAPLELIGHHARANLFDTVAAARHGLFPQPLVSLFGSFEGSSFVSDRSECTGIPLISP